MKWLPLFLLGSVALSYATQTPCSPTALSNAASRAHSLQEGLKRTQVDEMDTNVPAPTRDKLTQLKDALVGTADAALSCAEPSINPIELQGKLAEILSANPPQPPDNTIISKDDHRFDEFLGSYGHNLEFE